MADARKSLRVEPPHWKQQLIPVWLFTLASWLLPDAQSAQEGIRIAYLDPGSASIIWQALAGILIASFVAIQAYWQRIKMAFQGFSERRREEPEEKQEREEDVA